MVSTILQSKHIVITGGTSGIGLELVRQLYDHNTLSIIGRASERLDALKRDFPEIRVHEADLANPDAVAVAGNAIVAENEAVDLLINNAAVQHTPHFLDEAFRVETIQSEINTNLTAPVVLIYLLLPALLNSPSGVILNINSGLGLVPKTSSAVYCATKGGLNLLSQSLANQLEETGIRVVQAFLPLVETEMTKGRGRGKLTAAEAAEKILTGLAGSHRNIDVGKVRILRLLMRIAPSLAQKIMRRA